MGAAAVVLDAAEVVGGVGDNAMVGVGYRHELAPWLLTLPREVTCLEITAEHFFQRADEELLALAKHYTLFVHGLGLSLGTPGPLDPARLAQFARISAAAQAQWVSEHVAFTRADGIDLGHLNPVPTNAAMLQVIADHAREIADRCQRPIILENITSHLRMQGEWAETDFLNRLCARADCGLLLDVTNLYINSRNHGFDARSWLRELDPSRVKQLHIVGYSEAEGRLTDNHSEPIQTELLELAHAAVEHGAVEAIILERDDNFPASSAELAGELQKLEGLFVSHRLQ